MKDPRALLDGRIPVVILVEDSLGGVTSWSRRVKKVFEGHPKYNLIMVECPVYARETTGARDWCAPTREDVLEVLRALRPAIVVPNYAWEVFNLCAALVEEGQDLRTIGFCRTDEALYYTPLAWYEPIIAQFAAVSPECARILGDRLPARRDDIWTMPTGVWVPAALSRNWSVAPIRLIYGGRMSQVQKRVLDFAPLVEALLRMQVDFTLHLVGSGSQVEKLQAAMEKLPHGGRVRFTDALPPDAMPEVWREHDVFLQTSEYEGTSNSMLESMAEGTVPVVTDASSGIRGVIREGECGFIVPVGDMEAMAQCIAALAQAPARLEELGRAAHETAGAYSMERYRDKFSAMLDKALEQPMRRWTHDTELIPPVEKLIKKLKRRPSVPLSPTPHAAMQVPPPSREVPITLVAAADDNFSMPLAVMVRSVLDTLGQDRKLNLYILDGGISAANRKRLQDSWQDARLTVAWCVPDLAPLRTLKVSGHINAVAYARLLIPDLLPDSVDKAIYLDGDLVVEHDLGAMWDLDVAPYELLAVQDMTLPYVDSSVALPNYMDCAPYLTAARALSNPERHGIPATAKYLNSGVLVLNLQRWREQHTARRILDYLRDHKGEVIWHDQDGLNVVLSKTWAAMDERWNQIPHIFRYPNWYASPFGEQTFERVQRAPWIIHFSTRTKPWHYDGAHPSNARFFHYLDRTAWKGWRPPEVTNLLQNADFGRWGAKGPADWKRSPNGVLTQHLEGDATRLQLETDGTRKNVALTQKLVPTQDTARMRLLVTLRALCHEPGMLGLNAYIWVDGERRAFSRNHPGDGKWQTLRHEINVPIGVDSKSFEVMVVLRGGATRPALLGQAFAVVVDRNPGKPFRHSVLTRNFARLPDKVRRLLRKLEARLRK